MSNQFLHAFIPTNVQPIPSFHSFITHRAFPSQDLIMSGLIGQNSAALQHYHSLQDSPNSPTSSSVCTPPVVWVALKNQPTVSSFLVFCLQDQWGWSVCSMESLTNNEKHFLIWSINQQGYTVSKNGKWRTYSILSGTSTSWVQSRSFHFPSNSPLPPPH